MEHERRSDSRTLIDVVLKECVYHSYDQITKILTSTLWTRLPLRNGSKRFHKIVRQVHCETEDGLANERANLWWFQQELRCIFRDMQSVSEPILQYDDLEGTHVTVGVTNYYVKNEAMYWPPVVKFEEKSKTNFLDFCLE